MIITAEYSEKNGLAIHHATLEKLNNGYTSAKYLINGLSVNKPQEIKVSRFQDVNKMITCGMITQVKKQPKGTIKTGESYFRKKVMHDVFTDPKTGEMFAINYIQ